MYLYLLEYVFWHMFIIYDGNGVDMKLSGHLSMMAIMAESDHF